MFNSIEEAIEEIKKGNFVVVVDDEDRENEGDLVIAAEMISPDKINFMTQYARGLICMPICEERLDELRIPLMVEGPVETAFTVSVDHKDSGTGVSAMSRYITIKKILDETSRPEDFIRPGHLFPLKAHCDGVFGREGHTEASVELARLAGLKPAAVLCEILNKDGTMARRDDLMIYAREHGFKIISIEDLKNYIEEKVRLKDRELIYI